MTSPVIDDVTLLMTSFCTCRFLSTLDRTYNIYKRTYRLDDVTDRVVVSAKSCPHRSRPSHVQYCAVSAVDNIGVLRSFRYLIFKWGTRVVFDT